jgi:hypothetical protein
VITVAKNDGAVAGATGASGDGPASSPVDNGATAGGAAGGGGATATGAGLAQRMT